MVSDRPSRCISAPPARIAATEKFLRPGVFFRVQATAMSGATARAAVDDFARRRRHAGPDLDQGLRHFPAAQQRASLTLSAEKFLARRQGLAILDQPLHRGAGHFENFRRFRRQSQHHRASRGKSHAAALRADAEQVGGEIAIGRVIEKQPLQLREGNIRRHEIFDSVRWSLARYSTAGAERGARLRRFCA